MLKLFKTNIAIIPAALILFIMVFLRIDVIVSGFFVNNWQNNLAPYSKLYYYVLGESLVLNTTFNMLLSGVIIFVQSGIVISILSLFKSKIYTFLPAWGFILLMHLFPEYTFVSPPMLSFIFLLLAIRKLVLLTENGKQRKYIFEIGLFLGISTLFWLPSFLFIIVFLFFLNMSSMINLKTIVSIIFTFFIPFLYVFAYYKFFSVEQSMIPIFDSLSFNQFDIKFYPINQLLSAITTFVMFIFSTIVIANYFDKELRAFKDFLLFIFFFVINVFIVLIFQNENSFSVMIFLFFPLAIIFGLFFNRIKRKLLAEFAHLILLLTIIINFMYFT